MKSIVEGIAEVKGKVKTNRTTIADKIVGYIQNNPGRPSRESELVRMSSVKKVLKQSSRYEKQNSPGEELGKAEDKNEEPGKIEGGSEEPGKIEGESEEPGKIEDENKESGKIEDKNEERIDKEEQIKEEDVFEQEAPQDEEEGEENIRASDVFEESKDKRIARIECVKERRIQENPFGHGYVCSEPVKEWVHPVNKTRAPRFEINTKNSISDVNCELFVASKLNQMCDYITQKSDCIMF